MAALYFVQLRMETLVCEALITKARLDLPDRQGSAVAGAAVDFWGVVRSFEDGREITGIEH